MNLVGELISIPFAHHEKPLKCRVDRHSFGLAHFGGWFIPFAVQIQPLNHTIVGPVVVEEALPFVTGDPERVAAAVVAEAREIELVDRKAGMAEPVGLRQQSGMKDPPLWKIDLD